MQRKITSILLLILYITTNVGYSLNMHYMNGELMETSFTDESSCVMNCDFHANNISEKHFSHSLQEHIEWMSDNHQDNSGCSDHDIQIKIDDPQLDSKQEVVSVPFLPVVFVITYLELIPQLADNKNYTSENWTELTSASVPIYISYQRLIIYS